MLPTTSLCLHYRIATSRKREIVAGRGQWDTRSGAGFARGRDQQHTWSGVELRSTSGSGAHLVGGRATLDVGSRGRAAPAVGSRKSAGAPRRTASRIPLTVAARRTFRRTTRSARFIHPLASVDPSSPRRSPGQIGRWCAGCAPSARFRVGVHRAASRDSEPVLRGATPRPPTPGAARPPTPDRRAQPALDPSPPPTMGPPDPD